MTASFHLTLHEHIRDIPATHWDAAAGHDNPFVSHAFLLALEDSGCVGSDSGWLPRHAALRDDDGQIVAVAPLYLKTHSYGEYVFDHAWAEAYGRAGGRYYPKLQLASPFSPVTGPRLLVDPARADADQIRRALLAALVSVTDQNHLSSLHVTFATESEWQLMGKAGFLQRIDTQYHWENHGYGSFDDFLNALSARKRKVIRRERRDALPPGLTIETLSGADLREEHWDAFFDFYLDTGSRKWGQPYLNRRFFSLLGERLPDSVVLMLARRDGRYVAGALNLVGGGILYGRYWGAIEEHPFLHFELCYYQAIDYAIRHGLARVEAGAQGEHKLARGYLPSQTYSAHWIADPGFRAAVAAYLDRERVAILENMDVVTEFGPFRKD
ncbi:GNAT family N-acetyltransferase [Govanella unica]|uniref:GNAT family N-acetyltransferase n=1 Tax=Govanella unica TaxID=2975056 RepID=A0A9X3TWQ5_9PROT|nr:GNAT family N-acetyltransferase [Govania unica]MDA5193105.1 GNAT family N-acetyltransferase [Govania unica]